MCYIPLVYTAEEMQVAIDGESRVFIYRSSQLCCLLGLGTPIVSGNCTAIHSILI